MRRRWKRKSGYVTPDLAIPKKDLVEYNLCVNSFYDDWADYRDGLRDWYSDFKKIKRINPGVTWFREELYEKRLKMNAKQKKLLRRRAARKRGKSSE